MARTLSRRHVFIFYKGQPFGRFSASDVIILIVIAVLLYVGVRLALHAPKIVEGPAISLSPHALPYYTFLSISRMTAAYALSLLFTLVYGHIAAHHRRAEQVMMPLLDILQSVPILSFLPVVLLSLSAILPERIATELASIVLIFTSQVWNMTFAWYQSLTTIPEELREASAIFRFSGWLRFKVLELPFAAISLIWNSMMSWAGGWFFLMAAEIFTVGERDFRLPGLGAYLQEAAHQGNVQAILWGIGTLVLVIVALDQLVWRPLLAWADRFKLEMVEGENPPTSWFYNFLRNSRLLEQFLQRIWRPLNEQVDAWLIRRATIAEPKSDHKSQPWLLYLMGLLIVLGLVYGISRAALMLFTLPAGQWGEIGLGVLMTLLRVSASLLIALAWTIPVGVIIGTNRRAAAVLQPLIQIVASIPATALFPVFLLFIVGLPGGLNIAAIMLMLTGTQWYLLFNVIAGASAIPQDLKYTSALIGLSRWERWRTLILPSLFPYIITGAITASGGAWNASIVAEYVEFGGRTLSTIGIGALIARATATGDYHLLLAATLTMILTVILINRLLWRRLYHLAEEKYRME
ncbi:MAG: ABC transporter permease subunit [Anaerolineae bacterium]|nr:ABC transporter permease subunit [Anaerolineae bacterium]MDW8102127.1 ABC transporter permease subunit [Anaerolineae bacterium]